MIRPPQSPRDGSDTSTNSSSNSFDERINFLESEIQLQMKEKEKLMEGLAKLIPMNDSSNDDSNSEDSEISEETIMNLKEERESLSKQIDLMKSENENARLKAEEIQQKIEEVVKFREVLETQLQNAENSEKPEIKKIKKEIEEKQNKIFNLQKQAEALSKTVAKKKLYLNDLRYLRQNEYIDKKVELMKLKRRKEKWERINNDENTTFKEYQDMSTNYGFERNRLAEVLKVKQKEMVLEREKCEAFRNQYIALHAMIEENPH